MHFWSYFNGARQVEHLLETSFAISDLLYMDELLFNTICFLINQ